MFDTAEVLESGTLSVLTSTDIGVTDQYRTEIDQLGVLSGIAQELKGPITSIDKLASSNNKLFVFEVKGTPVGFLKCGERELYFYSKSGKVSAKQSLCLLDFYVDERMQRFGIGKRLFDFMLTTLNIPANSIAYDRPSPKLYPFLKKHFLLSAPDMQPNKFVIYPGFII